MIHVKYINGRKIFEPNTTNSVPDEIKKKLDSVISSIWRTHHVNDAKIKNVRYTVASCEQLTVLLKSL